MKEGEPPRKEKFSPESPITQALVEQWETLCIQNGMLQKCWEDAVTHKRSWLLVNSLSLWAELLEEDSVGISGGHLGRKKILCHLCRCLCWISMGQEVEWCYKLYHRRKRTGTMHSSSAEVVPVRHPHGEGSGGCHRGTAMYASR